MISCLVVKAPALGKKEWADLAQLFRYAHQLL